MTRQWLPSSLIPHQKDPESSEGIRLTATQSWLRIYRPHYSLGSPTFLPGVPVTSTCTLPGTGSSPSHGAGGPSGHPLRWVSVFLQPYPPLACPLQPPALSGPTEMSAFFPGYYRYLAPFNVPWVPNSPKAGPCAGQTASREPHQSISSRKG